MNTLTRRGFLSFALPAAALAPSLLARNGDGPDERPLDDEVLGQGDFRYRADRFWGRLDRAQHPVEDCHGIVEDRAGRILLLTTDTRNNFIAYDKSGKFLGSWEHRFPNAHGLRIENHRGEERYWITDYGIGVVSLCTPDGHEIRRIGPEAVNSKYPDLTKYKPTNVAFMSDGDFFVSDGYGSNFVHHFDPNWRYISSFGGTGGGLDHLNTPHSVWLDTRSGKPLLLICDRSNAMLKWFSLAGEFQRMVPLPGTLPSNISPWRDHLAITSLNGIVLILDGRDRVVSVVGGEPPIYVGDELQTIVPYNYAFVHPHDVHIDLAGNLYIAQWDSYRTYPMKLERLSAGV